jgi:tRNA-intron endonuclease
MIEFTIIKGKSICSNSDADHLFSKGYGERVNKTIEFSNFELLYLIEKEKIKILNKNKELSFTGYLKKTKLKYQDYIVYRDLREKGYTIKSGTKYGATFRVYEKGIRVGEDHATWLVEPINWDKKITFKELSGLNRVAHSTRKKLVFAAIDSENQISYLEMGWIRML